jgi:hypothetical protein
MAIRIIPLETVHDVKEFNCGNQDLSAQFIAARFS